MKLTKKSMTRAYDREKAAKTRKINKERKRKGLPTLAEEKKMKARKYKYTMAYAGKSGKFREFKGSLGVNAREWRKKSRYAHRVAKDKSSQKSIQRQ